MVETYNHGEWTVGNGAGRTFVSGLVLREQAEQLCSSYLDLRLRFGDLPRNRDLGHTLCPAKNRRHLIPGAKPRRSTVRDGTAAFPALATQTHFFPCSRIFRLLTNDS